MNSPRLRPQDCAVVIVDVQNDFCHPDGALARRGVEVAPPMAGVVDSLRTLIVGARAHRVPVIFVQTLHGPWTDAPTWIERMPNPEKSIERLPVCHEGTWGADFFGVSPSPLDRVVVKRRYSAFIDTDLDVTLRARQIRTLILAGVATNVCVESTGRDGFMKDYWVLTLSDCCAANSLAEHESGLFSMGHYFGEVATAQAVLDLWASMAPDRS